MEVTGAMTAAQRTRLYNKIMDNFTIVMTRGEHKRVMDILNWLTYGIAMDLDADAEEVAWCLLTTKEEILGAP